MTLMSDAPSHAPVPPVARPERGKLFVIYTGLITTALSLAGVYWLNKNHPDVNIMGWYVKLIIPIGALIVGLACGSGYGIGSAMSGKKISRSLLLTVVLLQVVAYFTAQYIEYREIVAQMKEAGYEPVGFPEYLHVMTTSIAWKQKNGEMGEPLGAWGYGLRALEITGFVLGGLIVPAVMSARPYCDRCRRYMKTRELGVIPAAVPYRKVKKSDEAGTAAYAEEQQRALDEGTARYNRLCELAAAGDAAAFQAELAPLAAGRKAADKLPNRYHMSLVRCEGCHSGRLTANLLSGTGDKTQTTPMEPVELSPEFVRQIPAKG